MSLRAALLLVAAALVQVTLFGRFEAAAPNCVLALCGARAWTAGGRSGMRWAIAGGLLLDIAGGAGPIGVHVLAMLVATYATGVLASAFESSAWQLAALAGAAGSVLYGAVVVAAADSLGLAVVSPSAALPLLAVAALTGAPATVAAVAGLRFAGRGTPAPTW